jgi:hypothetical protein
MPDNKGFPDFMYRNPLVLQEREGQLNIIGKLATVFLRLGERS